MLEAMKMEHVVVAPCAGVIGHLAARAGETVAAGTLLATIDARDHDGPGGPDRAAVDPDRVRPDLAEVMLRHHIGSDEYRSDGTARRHASGRRTARENIADLADESSFVEYGALTIAAQRRRRSLEDLIERTPADGLVLGTATVAGMPVAVMSYDYTVLAGTQGIQNHRKSDRLFELARRERLPVVIFAEGGGGRPGDTDTAAVAQLDVPTFRMLAELNGRVPLVAVVSGYCFAGNAALAAACDVIIATEGSSLGMGGPAMIEGGGLGVVAPGDVGPMAVQVRNGVVDVLVPDDTAAVAAARQYLGYFGGPLGRPADHRDQRVLRHLVPENRVRAYDIRPVIEVLFDPGSVLELRPQFGVGIITALARLDGRPVGILANSPRHLGGAIDGDAADKATRFLELCQAHRIAVISLCDTPGFMVGPEAEKSATVRRFGAMFVAGARLTVPLCMVVLRKGYGLGAMAMAGGHLKAPLLCVAWPTGEFGGMGLEGAVRLGFRKELDAITDPAERQQRYEQFVAEYYEKGKALSAAAAFEVDDVIDPAQTRQVLIAALARTRSCTGSFLAAERCVVPLSDRFVCLLVNECRGFGERRAAGPGREVARELALLDAPLRPLRQQPEGRVGVVGKVAVADQACGHLDAVRRAGVDRALVWRFPRSPLLEDRAHGLGRVRGYIAALCGVPAQERLLHGIGVEQRRAGAVGW